MKLPIWHRLHRDASTPCRQAGINGSAARRACAHAPTHLAVVGEGGLGHAPAELGLRGQELQVGHLRRHQSLHAGQVQRALHRLRSQQRLERLVAASLWDGQAHLCKPAVVASRQLAAAQQEVDTTTAEQ